VTRADVDKHLTRCPHAPTADKMAQVRLYPFVSRFLIHNTHSVSSAPATPTTPLGARSPASSVVFLRDWANPCSTRLRQCSLTPCSLSPP
jgi:hypothetical protein